MKLSTLGGMVLVVLSLCTAGLAQSDTDPAGAEPKPAEPLKLDDFLKATATPALVIPKESITTAEYAEQKRAWLERTLMPAVSRELPDIPNKDKLADRMKQVFVWWTIGRHASELKTIADELSSAVPVDANAPVLHCFIGLLQANTGSMDDAMARWRASVSQTDPASMPVLPGLISATRVFGRTNPMTPNNELEARLLQLIRAACEPSQCKPEDTPHLIGTMVTFLSGTTVRRLAPKLIGLLPKSPLPEWARQTLIGYCEVGQAWNSRGGGWASGVTEEGWKGWEKHLTAARTALSSAWKLRPDHPAAATMMIEVEMGTAGATPAKMRQWFDRAIAAQCDYDEAYEKMLWGLRPRWHGSHSDLLAFGVACAKTQRFDTEVPWHLISALMSIVMEGGDWRPIMRHPQVAALLTNVIKGRLAKIEDEETLRATKGHCVVYAWMAGDYKLAAEYLRTFTTKEAYALPRATRSMMDSLDIDFTGMISQVRSLATPFRDFYERSEQARAAGDYEKALKILDDAPPIDPKMNLGLPIFQRELLTFERDFRKGGWLTVPLGVRHWAKGGGTWKHTTTSLDATTVGSNPAHAHFRGIVGPRFEVRGKVILPEGPPSHATFHVIIGHPGEYVAGDTRQWLQFVCETEDYKTSKIRIGHSSVVMRGVEPQPGPDVGAEIPFRFRRDGDKVSWWLGEKEVVADLEVPADLPDGPCAFGLGGRTYGGKAPIRFSEIEIRLVGKDG